MSKYTSKGIHKTVNQKTLNAMKRNRDPFVAYAYKHSAWLKGKNPWITIENPNKEETNRPYIRVKMNDTNLGHPKELNKKRFIMS